MCVLFASGNIVSLSVSALFILTFLSCSTVSSKINDQIMIYNVCLFVCLMVFNATFNNISVISWRSVLLVEETGGPRENHRPVTSH
jgi:hypothetical protein